MTFLSTDAYILARTQRFAHWIQRTYGMTNFRLAEWCLYLMLLGCCTCLLYSHYTAPPQSMTDMLLMVFLALTPSVSLLMMLPVLRQEDGRARGMPYHNWRTSDPGQMHWRLICTGLTLWVAIFLLCFPSPGLGFLLCFGAGLSSAGYLSACTPKRT